MAGSHNGGGTSAHALAWTGPRWIDHQPAHHTPRPQFKLVEPEHETIIATIPHLFLVYTYFPYIHRTNSPHALYLEIITCIFSQYFGSFRPRSLAISAPIRPCRTCCETTMFAAATSFFARSNISQNYNVGGASSIVGSRSSTPSQGSSSNPGVLPAPSNTPTFFVGPWKVQSGSHKTTHKRVSIWTFDKRSSELEKMGPASKERTLEVLKSEVRATYLCGSSGYCAYVGRV